MSKPIMKPCGNCRGEGRVAPSGMVLLKDRNGHPAKLVCKKCGGKGKVPVKR